MLGAIAGDIIGSPYEGRPTRDPDFPLFGAASRFTDDTALTVATAEALLEGGDYAEAYRCYGRMYPNSGYGGTFIHWIFDETLERLPLELTAVLERFQSAGAGWLS